MTSILLLSLFAFAAVALFRHQQPEQKPVRIEVREDDPARRR